MADVFISYARDNAAAVRGLAEAVAREGYSVWWDDALPPHLSYSDVITGEIGAAKAVIVVWSEKAIASEWVRAEADLARNQKKLIQTSIDGRMPPMPFNQLHFVSIGDWRGEADHPGWARVKESLAALCGGAVTQPTYAFPSTAPPRPAPPPPARNPALRPALIVLIGLLLLGVAGAGVFWLTGGQGVSTASPPAQADTAPRLSAPREQSLKPPPAAAPRPREKSSPLPRPPAANPQSEAARADAQLAQREYDRAQQLARAGVLSPAELEAARMRRYCTGPGRGTPQCRQMRARMSRPAAAAAD